ncbi:lecithin--cholesterol acyltransferase [Waterburya agarophytonicola K14]|uniref:Lecithin--cholesterol acyltransferase n=1 Tax=Waterburya agarophytonicola KI4 TaxID=2874699 RepID=A0A964FKG2_9CYAN|nr:lecithin--cholesterol acyltransferase [Waterburya agarophytonicola]MCC0178738.1 lecithin--cholesterol acyltransferase [Waterburya agarophytonicola KI4]
MSKKNKMRDIIVLLPGILGSSLQKDGRDLWNISGQAISDFVKNLRKGNNLQHLKIKNDDPTLDDLGDGIKATSLMQDFHFLPGFWKIDGYTKIADSISKEFNVTLGENYFEFPYDWRRDNRVAARKLEKLMNLKLSQWRESSGAKNAKVILIAHSMGGLVSRYYLEKLGGWQNCRALITFGTPYRGSVQALDYLANGYKGIFGDLTEVVRSLTSTYQLLPIYKMVKIGDDYHRIAEIANIPNLLTREGESKNEAEKALEFHREIEAAQKLNAQEEDYQNNFVTIPYVGTEQKTWQSAELSNSELTVSWELPPNIGNERGSGDGTVPRLSASPIEFDTNSKLRFFSRYVAAKHNSIQNNGSVLVDLIRSFQDLEISEQEPIRGDLSQTGISLEVEDFFLKDEPVIIKADVKGRFPQHIEEKLELKAQITSVSTNQVVNEAKLQKSGAEWLLALENLDSGLYRLEVKTEKTGGGFPNPVSDVFEVG